MRFEYASTALMLLLYFSNALAFSTGNDAANVAQAHLGLTGQSESASHGNSAGGRVLNAVAAILNLYDFMAQSNPSEHGKPKTESSQFVPESKAALTDQNLGFSSGDWTDAPDEDIITTSCKGPNYCCCATGCETPCPSVMLPAFPELKQSLSARDIDIVRIPCRGLTYCCCKTGCPSSTNCPWGIEALIPKPVEEIASRDEL